MGQPSNIEDRMAEEAAKEEREAANPDWQDPKLLREIKASTGMDLELPSMKKKRGKKEKRRRYPGLADISAEQDSCRKRLEKKVFNRSSSKRVAAALDKADSKRFKDKFGDQFNYVFTK